MAGLSFSLQDLRRTMSAAYVERGAGYAREGRIHDREYLPDKDRYSATVNGSQAEPYRVNAQVLAGRTGLRVYGTCTCSMAVNCKHVAAVLIDALTNGRHSGTEAAGAVEETDSVRRPPAPQQAGLPFELTRWLEHAERVTHSPPTRDAYPPGVAHRLLYLLPAAQIGAPARAKVQLVLARLRKAGGYSAMTQWNGARGALRAPPAFVLAQDLRILRRLLLEASSAYGSDFFLDEIDNGGQTLSALLATGRCHYGSIDTPPLHESEPRRGRAGWEYLPDGVQQLVVRTDPSANAIVPLAPLWYVDCERAECGPVETGLPAAVAQLLTRAPLIAPEQAARAKEELLQRAGSTSVPLPQVPETVSVRDLQPVPCLELVSLQAFARNYRPLAHFVDIAALRFDYAGVLVNRDSPGILTTFRDGCILSIKRDHRAEKRAHDALRELGFIKLLNAGGSYPQEHRHDYTLNDPGDWVHFVGIVAPRLRAEGWRIELDRDFRFRTAQLGQWYGRVEDAGHEWFELDLGVEIDGKPTPLLPILVAAVRSHPELLRNPAAPREEDAGVLVVRMDDGRFAPIPLARVRPLLTVLHELIDAPLAPTVRLPRLDAVRLTDLESGAQLQLSGGEPLRELGAKLSQFSSVAEVSSPHGLQAQLRAYQAQGLAWLQFLREYGLHGILADDMGLGKTVEALAHILVEKHAGRLQQPALIVCPTSLVPNWKAETARFAPQLRVHVSHGLKRKSAFGEMQAADIVLTTYPLLARDRETLAAQPFHLVILDEAQQIKNAQTQAARVVGQLQGRHRLCLTGTPLENHLGELWSLFHFLMPGFLGDAQLFRRLYRTPIEKQGDEMRRTSLVRRLRPFILRRTKQEVAADLPPKTEIVLPVELAGGQRDLYETLRVSMHERVRAEIAARGLQQSQIVVLDALLKLRQVCCDPRLVKLDAARKVKESAKLDALMELLDELLNGAHRVLLFSQFTSMLELIEKELARREARYLKLTGETRERAKPVKAFQAGEVPLFLVSLKAGGTGLNLTAADTVIHYDPWWNPAVENQATDRAHRIGQDKRVFVYKLIVQGSVEEKIAQLQASKAALAAGVLDEGGAAGRALTAEDIAALFEPLA